MTRSFEYNKMVSLMHQKIYVCKLKNGQDGEFCCFFYNKKHFFKQAHVKTYLRGCRQCSKVKLVEDSKIVPQQGKITGNMTGKA